MKNKAVIFMMSMVLAMGSAVPAHADTEISENKDLAENGQGVSEYANGWVTGDNDTFFYIDGIKLYDAGCGTILMQQVQCRKITGEKKMGNGIIMMRMGIW